MDSSLKSPADATSDLDRLRLRVNMLEAENRRLTHEAEEVREAQRAAGVLQDLIDNVREVLWITDWVERRELYVSKSYETIWGLSCESLYRDAASWMNSIHPDDQARVQEAWQRDAETGHYEQEYRILRSDGAVRWIYDRAFPIRDAEDRICRVAGISEDITKRKEAEAALRRARDELEHRIKDRTAALTNANQRLQSREAALRRIVEGTAQVGTEFFHTVVQQLAAALGVRFAFVSQVIESGGTCVKLRAFWNNDHHDKPFDYDAHGKPCEAAVRGQVCLHASGVRERFPADDWLAHEGVESYLAIPVCDSADCVLGHLGVADTKPLEDVALAESILRLCAARVVAELGREAAEREKTRLRERLYQAQKMKAVGELAGGVAHDFNNLLTLMFAGIDEIEEHVPVSDAAQAALGLIRDAAGEAEEVTQALIAVSQPGLEGREPIDLGGLVDDLGRILRALLPAVVEARVHNRPGMPFWINGDASQIRRVIMNLVSNARDAMPDGGHLEITLGPADPGVRQRCGLSTSSQCVAITVTDDGQGIPPKVLPRVTEPFFTTKTRTKGTGLGLAIAHRIVRDHGGRLDIQSVHGQGTTVKVLLPLIEAPAVASQPVAATPIPRGAGELLLVAEDNVQVERLIAAVLKDHGYEVTSVGDGLAAVDRYREFRGDFRAAILDIDLPGCSGLDCVELIRAEDPETPIILITGQAPPQCADQLDPRTVLLPKPFRMARLAELVHELPHAS